MPNKIDVIGRMFGRVVVLRDGARQQNGRRSVDCRCSCGVEFNCDPRLLLQGKTRSCGCYHRDAVSASSAAQGTHGMTRTPEYNIWIKIKGRCANRLDHKYPDYGGRGITVCSEWQDNFEAFFAALGPKPESNSSIDRIDVNGNYEPGNCRWATPKMQARNKRYHRFVEFDGRTVPLSEACELAGVNYRSALYRLNTGKDWRPLPTPPDQGSK